jgi:hypothetical protein
MYRKSVLKLLIVPLLIILINCNSIAENTIIRIPFKLGNLYGFVDESLFIVIPPQFDRIEPFFDRQFTAVRWNYRRSGVIDLKGSTVFETSSSQLRHIYNDLYAFDTNNGKGIYDLKKNRLLVEGLNHIYSSDNGIMAVSFVSPVRSTYINEEGEDLFPDKNYRRTFPFSEGIAIVINRDWYSYLINEEGKFITTKKFSRTGQQFSDGLLFVVDEDGYTGFIDTTGQFVFNIDITINDENPALSPFNNGVAAVRINDQQSIWILINKKGEQISKELFVSYIDQFQEGFARFTVSSDGNLRWGFIDQNGNRLNDNLYEYAESFVNNYAIIIHQGRDALLRKDGEIIYIEDIL